MVDSQDNLADAIRTATTEVLESWGILHDHSSITLTQVRKDHYEVTVSIRGRVLLTEVLDDQGALLGIRNDIEVALKGFQDDQLLLKVDIQ